jgi:sec-independent protein translocase protein TatC
MPTASPSHSEPSSTVDYTSKKPNGEFDPDHYRMTIGEHLEELRGRLVYGLIGFGLALILCLIFSKSHVVPWFCRPLVKVLAAKDINPQLVVDQVGEGFMVYITIALISAAAIASPWMLYQLWQFVAAGLFPHERKYVTRYLPVSIGLLISGMLFVYFLVLPWSLEFFVDFNETFQVQVDAPARPGTQAALAPGAATVPAIPLLRGDPPKPTEGQLWLDVTQGKLKLFFGGRISVIGFTTPNLIAQEYKLSHYIELVIGMLITFGLSFQLPLVVLALERIGVVDVAALRAGRQYVYFALVIISAVITPGDYVTATVALIIPLIGLYELGILMATMGKKPGDAATA